MSTLGERIEGLLREHNYKQYSLRSGCSCGWGTTLCTKQEGWEKWAKHIAELAAALAAEGQGAACGIIGYLDSGRKVCELIAGHP